MSIHLLNTKFGPRWHVAVKVNGKTREKRCKSPLEAEALNAEWLELQKEQSVKRSSMFEGAVVDSFLRRVWI